jgi:iron complex outermembrane recepter protein
MKHSGRTGSGVRVPVRRQTKPRSERELYRRTSRLDARCPFSGSFENLLGMVVTLLLATVPCVGQQPDLSTLSIEELANIQVTSASKRAESLSGAPAAIYVLTGEEIRRGGFITLPEALRMVPGLYVGRTDSHIWQISTRGFSDLNNNKILVLVDGRSVYTPQFGSVFWDVLDMPLEDIERVEVIRGPGGTLWGANAVNGVINIVTKRAAETQGFMFSGSASPEAGYASTIQYGGRIGSTVTYRIFGRASYWEPLQAASDINLPDYLSLPQAGTRVDWAASRNDNFSIDAGTFDGRVGSTVFNTRIPATFLIKSSHVLAQWKHSISDRSSTDTLAYCDWYARYGTPAEMPNTCDLEFQHSYAFNQRHSLIWGGSFFSTGDDLSADPASFVPERRRNNVVSAFAQYELAIVPDRLRVIGGAKIEHNGYTGFEYQPQVRAVWTPSQSHTFWISFSRTVRIPARNESNLQLSVPAGTANGLPVILNIAGDPNLLSERVKAFEVGYRVQVVHSLSLDTTLFYNNYRNLIGRSQPVPEFFPNRILLDTQFANAKNARETNGGGLSLRWRPIDRWTVSPGVTEIRGSAQALPANPKHLINLQSRLDLARRIEFDSGFYHYSSVPLGAASPANVAQGVPAFSRVDVGMCWHLNPRWPFAVRGQNLQSEAHRETRDTVFGNQAGDVPRSVVFQLGWNSNTERSGGNSQ